jgi:hypothetical protein
MQKEEGEDTLNQTPLDSSSNKRVLLNSNKIVQSVKNLPVTQPDSSHKLNPHREDLPKGDTGVGVRSGKAVNEGISLRNELYGLQSIIRPIDISPFRIPQEVFEPVLEVIGVDNSQSQSNLYSLVPVRSEPSNLSEFSNSSSYHDDSSLDYPDDIEEVKDQSHNGGELIKKEENKEVKGDLSGVAEPRVKEANIFRKQIYANERRAKGTKTFKEILKFPEIPRTLSTSAFSSIFRYMKKLIRKNKGKIMTFLLSIGFKREAIEDSISVFNSYDLYNKSNIQLKTLKQLICKIIKERSIYAYLMQLSLGVTLKSINKSEFTRFSRTNLPSYKRIVEVCYEESIRVLQRRVSIPDVNKKLQFTSV